MLLGDASVTSDHVTRYGISYIFIYLPLSIFLAQAPLQSVTLLTTEVAVLGQSFVLTCEVHTSQMTTNDHDSMTVLLILYR